MFLKTGYPLAFDLDTKLIKRIETCKNMHQELILSAEYAFKDRILLPLHT